jgi:hypothetical protein
VKEDTVLMFRPTGPQEWALVAASGCRRWPPRLPDQPIFYPVTNEQYAIEIARDWNVRASGEGYVTRFRVKKAFMDRYPVQQVGGAHHTEWWVPAEELEALNEQIVGPIEPIWRFDAQGGHFLAAPIPVERYADQLLHWPESGEHVLAQYDDESVVVYQAYRPSIARYALEHGRFGGPDFSFGRMSWIKPNFLWMMFRSGWAMKQGQEMVLALRLRRDFFDELLRQAVPSSWDTSQYDTREKWAAAVETSEVRLQWDPDHAPSGAKVPRRALQLGLRGSMLAAMASDALIEVIDMTEFVASQRPWAQDDSTTLVTPTEHVYPWPSGRQELNK